MRWYRIAVCAALLGLFSCRFNMRAPAKDEGTVATNQGLIRENEELHAGSRNQAAGTGTGDQAGAKAPGEGQRSDFRVTEIPNMLVRTGQASIEIDSLESGVVLVRQLAQRVGGYVANTSLQAGREQVRTATLEIKVPVGRFDEVVSGLSPIGKVEYVNIAAEDVGEEFTDVTARVANAHRLEQRLIDILATRTGKLKDVLEVEHELARVREEIERYEGRLRYLKARTAMSTFSVRIHEVLPILQQPGASPILDAARQAWQNFLGLTAAGIASLGVVLPLSALGIAAWFGVKRVRRAW